MVDVLFNMKWGIEYLPHISYFESDVQNHRYAFFIPILSKS